MEKKRNDHAEKCQQRQRLVKGIKRIGRADQKDRLPRLQAIVLMEGDYGAGKSAISQRLSYGLCQEGASVTYLSTELTVRFRG